MKQGEQMSLFKIGTPKMPDSFKGEEISNGGFTNTTPRKWTKEELDFVKELKKQGYSNKEISESTGRSEVSIQIKLKRTSKSENTYNQKHVKEKYKINEDFLQHIKPKSILDVYAGNGFYVGKVDRLIQNDIDEEKNTDFNLDSLRLMSLMYFKKETFDIIDLDPFGSAYDCFDLAIKMAKKGLIITFGELGHQRWKRLDFVSRYYGIEKLEDFTLENMIKEVQKIGLRNKKHLRVIYQREWQNIGRVWFEIEEYKITEQWD